VSPRRNPKSKRSTRRSDSAHERAQRFMDRAWESKNPREQIALAQQALEVSPDCADASLMLAHYAPSAESALPLLEMAVDASARELGEDGFREFAGGFWGYPQTRPYMRARLELAECLMELGRGDDAIAHYQAMLELNPDDNQGCRYRLASALLQSDRLEDVESLLEKYPDDYSAEWYYTRALLAFKAEGDSETARTRLCEAQKMNRYVPAFLARAERLPPELPDFISPGEETEAVSFVAEFLPTWRATPGAIPWLRRTLEVSLFDGPRKKRTESWKSTRRILLQIPQEELAVWELELIRLPEESPSAGRGWALLIVDAETTQPLLMHAWEDRPHDSEIWQHLLETMRNSEQSEPRRPRLIRLTRKTLARTWSPKLEQVGVACELTDDLPHIAEVQQHFERVMTSSGPAEQEVTIDEPTLDTVPQAVGDVWRAEVRQIPAWIQIGGKMCRPIVRVVFDATNDWVLTSDLCEEEPPEDWLWEAICSAICRPAMGEPRRPGVVELSHGDLLENLRSRLERIGVRCAISDDTQEIDALIDSLTDHLVGPRRSNALIRTPGVTPERLSGFFSAAADFYRAAPWRQIPSDTIIHISTEAFSSGNWYAVVMGQRGMELGIALYEDLTLLERMLTGTVSDEEMARQHSGLSVTYGEVFEIAPEDSDAIDQFGWPVAADEAYPSVLRVNPGLAMRAPLAWELELLEACLRAIPGFIQSGNRDVSSWAVSTSAREITVQLARIESRNP